MTLRTLVRRKARNRNRLDPSIPREANPAVITLVKQQASPTKVHITFNTRVMLGDDPGYKAGAGATATVTDAVQISNTVVEVTFSAATAGNPVIVPANDLAIRTPSGGIVPPGSYTITP